MNEIAEGLRRKKCAPCTPGTTPLSNERIRSLLAGLDGWAVENGALTKRYRFRDYYDTLAFVNASAWISHREDHHPDLQVGYNHCTVTYVTHAIGGLSENDFICAAKLDALFE
ncbi:MAG TPA: 4a-hydroxytetrahydrobiopterin dehydratase [Burkholderiales bacterium]|nr:4a-hydroxytetrahydrobiopterin dehydratase [Burkholderiales bacterium]